ncbi:MAG: MOSC domain-containing protein [Dermatophilaceae bacterium]|nr:MOSC domain-containing protein [Intrasporangiaceae bacterium]
MTTVGTVVGTVVQINRFPVKSMQGESVESVAVDENGIVGDRTWALRDVETDKLVSAKRPRLWRAMLDCRATGTGGDVIVDLPGSQALGITDPALPEALRGLLGRAVAVEAAMTPGQGVYDSDWPEIDGVDLSGELELPTNLTGEGTSFIDLGVLHLLTTASLDTLADIGPDTAADARRFRPSIIIETPDFDGFAEDAWQGRAARIGEIEIVVGHPAPRCVMTTLQQGDLPAERGVLTTLAAHHRVSTSLGTFACLGAYATVRHPGRLHLGDSVELC